MKLGYDQMKQSSVLIMHVTSCTERANTCCIKCPFRGIDAEMNKCYKKLFNSVNCHRLLTTNKEKLYTAFHVFLYRMGLKCVASVINLIAQKSSGSHSWTIYLRTVSVLHGNDSYNLA